MRRPEHAAGWTEDRLLQLRALWRDGLSAGQIAEELGGGVTRNGVLGKVHRLGIAARAKVSQSSNQGRQLEARMRARMKPPKGVRPERTTRFQPRPALTASPPVDLMQLGFGMCRWPLWGDYQPPSGKFCGGSAVDGLPYCAGHCRLAYTAPEARRGRSRPYQPRNQGAR